MQFPPPDSRILPASIECVPTPDNSPTKQEEKVVSSLVGLAIGDALGASVEFRPRQYLLEHPVNDMQSGGTWGLNAGQWTDDTSMALCLASSLITQHGYNPYDQMVRYKWWYKKGFLSSTGHCFDIGRSTRAALEEFCRRQNILKQQLRHEDDEEIDHLTLEQVRRVKDFNEYCGSPKEAGNGPLMRLAPIPLFYFRQPEVAVKLAGDSARLTHADPKAVDACRYYAALIVAAICGESKKDLLDERFYENHQRWFGTETLDDEVLRVVRGSYKKARGYEEGIRGKSYVINTLEAALWAFWSDENSFEKGVLNAVNLGDDTDTTAAVYGQLAGAYYGPSSIFQRWGGRVYAINLIICVGRWLYFEGSRSRSDTVQQQQQQTQITSRQQNQQRMPTEQPSQHSRSHPSTQINSPSVSADRVGYQGQNQQKAPQHARTQAPAQSQPTTNSNTFNSHNARHKQSKDPSTLPAAGIPSGGNKK